MQNIKNQILVVLLIVPFVLIAQKTNVVKATPIAYIEQSKILKSLKGFEQNSQEVDSLKQVYTQEIQESTKKLEEKISLLLAPYQLKEKETVEAVKAKLKDNDLAKFELYIQESELIDKTTKNYDLSLKTLYDQKIQPLIDKLNKTIEEYAKANKIAVIYTLENIGPALAYIDKEINITNEIIVLLN